MYGYLDYLREKLEIEEVWPEEEEDDDVLPDGWPYDRYDERWDERWF